MCMRDLIHVLMQSFSQVKSSRVESILFESKSCHASICPFTCRSS